MNLLAILLLISSLTLVNPYSIFQKQYKQTPRVITRIVKFKDRSGVGSVPLEFPDLGLPVPVPAELPDLGLPVRELPDLGLPFRELPDLGLPVRELPDLGLPVRELPDLGLPVRELPDLGLPVPAELPDLGLPVRELPDLGLPVRDLGFPGRAGLSDLGLPVSIPTEEVKIPSITSGVARQSTCSNVQYVFSAPGQQAIILSPGHPNNYPTNSDCSYFISSPQGTTMSVSCDMNVACWQDLLFFSWTGSSTFADGEYYCGYGAVAGKSTGNQLSIGFQSDSWPEWGWNYNYQCTITVSQSTATTTTTTTTTSLPTPSTQPTTTQPTPSTQPTTTQPTPTTTTTPPQSCSCGVRNPSGVRIVGGSEASNGEYPWRVLVFVYNPATGSGGICGGTIISPNWILTAAHCTMNFQPGQQILVYTEAQANPVSVGGGVRNDVDRYVQHPAFNRQTLDNDMALLHLTKPLTFKSTVSPACLPFSQVGSSYAGITVTASGWGTTKPVPVGQDNHNLASNVLLEVDLPVLTTVECKQYLGTAVNENQLCTYLPGKDSCQGDSGGSIDYQTNSFWYAIGIVSWGNGCAQQNEPGVYTKVIRYLDFIQTTTQENFCKK